MPENGLSQLRNALISALSGDPTLDAAALKDHLNGAGFNKEIGDILSESIYVHAAFAAPAYDPAMVSSRWMEFWRDMQGRAAAGEIKEGWMNAFQAGNAEDEDKLKTILRMKGSDTA